MQHGLSYHPLYQVWKGIKARCLNPNNRAYRHYGDRGITIASEWLHNPQAFIEWVEEHLGPRPLETSLDRIDNDGDYEPGNLRWATRSQQVRNRRGTNSIEIKGVSHNGKNWKAQIHLDKQLIHLGTFDTTEEAAAAYIGACRLLDHINDGRTQ